MAAGHEQVVAIGQGSNMHPNSTVASVAYPDVSSHVTSAALLASYEAV